MNIRPGAGVATDRDTGANQSVSLRSSDADFVQMPQ